MPACTPVPGRIGQVWVIDGRPDYHRKDCSRVSRGEADEVPRPRPSRTASRVRAVPPRRRRRCAAPTPRRADGRPTQVRAASRRRTTEPAAVASPRTATAGRGISTGGSVWVVDGRPRYHLEDLPDHQGPGRRADPARAGDRGRLHAVLDVRAQRQRASAGAASVLQPDRSGPAEPDVQAELLVARPRSSPAACRLVAAVAVRAAPSPAPRRRATSPCARIASAGAGAPPTRHHSSIRSVTSSPAFLRASCTMPHDVAHQAEQAQLVGQLQVERDGVGAGRGHRPARARRLADHDLVAADRLGRRRRPRRSPSRPGRRRRTRPDRRPRSPSATACVRLPNRRPSSRKFGLTDSSTSSSASASPASVDHVELVAHLVAQ